MSDFVYKQMINKVDNTPITGGSFFLRNVETLDEFVMTELPDDPGGSSQGRYVTDDEVPNGVYKIFRVVSGTPTDTGDEVHVEPGRVNHGGSGGTPYYPVTSRVVGDVVHAVAFLSDSATSPTIATINQAMAWAVTNGYSKVCVGTYKGDSSWSDSIQLQIPAGLKELDLAGASIECTTLNLIPVVNSSGVMSIHDGTIQGNGTGSTSHVRSESAIVYYNVRFVGFGGGPPVQGWTTSTGSGTPTKFTIYMGCTGVRVDAGRRLRSTGSYGYGGQVAIGGEWPIDTATQTGGTYRDNIIYSDVDAGEATAWFRSIVESVGIDPVDTLKFSSVENAAAALKSLWFKHLPVFTSKTVMCDRVPYVGSMASSIRCLGWNGDFTSSVSIDTSDVASSVVSGVTQGFIVNKYRRYSSSNYDDIEVNIVASWALATLTGVSGYILWRPYQISFSSTDLLSALKDIDGSTSIVPADWIGRKNVSVEGIFSQRTGTGTNQNITINVTGGELVYDAVNSKFILTFEDVSSSNSAMRAREWLNRSSTNSQGPVVANIYIRWTNPNNTSIPRIG